jgi:Flp pilus assembly protein TadB
MTAAFALLALALMLTPRHPRRAKRGTAVRDGAGDGGAPQRPLRVLQVVVAIAAVGACVALFGAGRGLLASGVAVPLAVWLIGVLHRRPARVAEPSSLALALDLVSAALMAGQTLPAALDLSAPAAGSLSGSFTRVAGLLKLGADPADAWSAVAADPRLAPVAAAAKRSASSGSRLAATFAQLAHDVREARAAVAQARAERVAVLIAAPLGLCFLPAFVCLGIVPTVIGVAGTVLSRT